MDFEKLIAQAIGPDDKFRFHCTACGQCCKNREDILLNPYDLYRIASFLDMEMAEVVQKYCIWYIGNTSKLPVVAVNMRGPEKVCPFLENNLCSIHAAKPTVCALYPLGRIGAPDGIRYMVQDVKCGTDEDEQTVREWVDGLAESESWFSEWQKVLVPLCEKMKVIAAALPENNLEMLERTLFVGLYIAYDRNKDFMEQFRESARHTADLLESIYPLCGSNASTRN